MRDINLILENIVYMELLRRGYAVTVGRNGNKEIDFVCEQRGERLYVQVAYLLASDDTVNREFGAYQGIRDNFPKYVVSLDAPEYPGFSPYRGLGLSRNFSTAFSLHCLETPERALKSEEYPWQPQVAK